MRRRWAARALLVGAGALAALEACTDGPAVGTPPPRTPLPAALDADPGADEPDAPLAVGARARLSRTDAAAQIIDGHEASDVLLAPDEMAPIAAFLARSCTNASRRAPGRQRTADVFASGVCDLGCNRDASVVGQACCAVGGGCVYSSRLGPAGDAPPVRRVHCTSSAGP